MSTSALTNTSSISTVDALWTLISSQPAAIRKAIGERLKASEEEAKTLRQQRMVRKRLTAAMKEVRKIQKGEKKGVTLEEMLNEL